MTHDEYTALQERQARSIIRHIRVSTTPAMFLETITIERMIEGWFQGVECVTKRKKGQKRCSACRAFGRM